MKLTEVVVKVLDTLDTLIPVSSGGAGLCWKSNTAWEGKTGIAGVSGRECPRVAIDVLVLCRIVSPVSKLKTDVSNSGRSGGIGSISGGGDRCHSVTGRLLHLLLVDPRLLVTL